MAAVPQPPMPCHTQAQPPVRCATSLCTRWHPRTLRRACGWAWTAKNTRSRCGKLCLARAAAAWLAGSGGCCAARHAHTWQRLGSCCTQSRPMCIALACCPVHVHAAGAWHATCMCARTWSPTLHAFPPRCPFPCLPACPDSAAAQDRRQRDDDDCGGEARCNIQVGTHAVHSVHAGRAAAWRVSTTLMLTEEQEAISSLLCSSPARLLSLSHTRVAALAGAGSRPGGCMGSTC